ncbi:MAG: Rrf2 family transcriptional regulator [Christensenellaceae bacterium]|nr:Rrf2 family transcriptional regulator [Christensenellaceae bacterium]
MKLSTRGKYGLYAMFYLAQHAGEGCQPLKAVAEIGVQEDYLEQLLGGLRRAGLVTTVRGAQGGYALARAPEEITVGDIIDALEGPLNISECVGDGSCCNKSGQCQSRRVWEYLSRSINDLLGSITLRDMLEQERFGMPDQSKETDHEPHLS